MQYFRQMESGLTAAEFQAIKHEILSQDDLWLADQTRQKMAPPQMHTHTVFLRAPAVNNNRKDKFFDRHDSEETHIANKFPLAMQMLYRLAEEQGAELCRVLYVKLLPWSVVYRHYDDGDYFIGRDRYHFVVDSDAGSIMACGDELITMQERELWWFDNKSEHESANKSDKGRVHLIFDLLPAQAAKKIANG